MILGLVGLNSLGGGMMASGVETGSGSRTAVRDRTAEIIKL